MFKTIRNAFKVKELRGKFLYTFMMLVVIRFGCQLPIPGIETSFFANWFAKQTTDVFGFFNAMTGGSFSSMSIFALSITPYITSSIIIQLLTVAIPALERLAKEGGEEGRKKIAAITRYVTVAIGLALLTKETYSSLFIGIVVGALLATDFSPIGALDTIINDGLTAAIADNAGIFLFLVILGVMVALVNATGGSAAFGRWAASHIHSKAGALLATFALGVLIFIDDYFNCLTVGSVMTPVTDSQRISRVKLAYLIDATAAPICMIAPISSWAAAVSGVAAKLDTGVSGIQLFIEAIPYNFYSLLTIVFVITMVVLGVDYGPMAAAELKAAQTGGPSGGCIPAEHIDTPIDYDNLAAIGTMMGSGGLIVMDEDTCMVDIAKFFLEFTVDESCGKCPPCRIGTKRMLEILEKITDGRGELEDIDKLETLAKNIKASALCGLGQTAPNPILSTLRYFRDEYIAHVVDKKCPAGVCKKLIQIKINPDICKSCGICAKLCPTTAIRGEKKVPYEIDQSKCLKCGACVEKCPFKAIYKEA